MHPTCTCPSLSPLRLTAVLLLLLGAAKEGYGQRVYADTDQISPFVILASVSNRQRATDSDTSNFSTLSVSIGGLGLITAHQNLQYVTRPKPTAYTPIIVKFGSQSSLLNLLGGFTIQRTNGGRTGVVPPPYSGSQLLNLLNLFGGSQVGTAIIPPDGTEFDGVRLEVSTVLGVGLQAYYYYAFYITPPQIAPTLSICEGESINVSIENIQPNYTYRVYTAELAGSEITEMASTSGAIQVPATLQSRATPYTFWIEAREADQYPSARSRLDVTVTAKPPAPNVTLNPNSQY